MQTITTSEFEKLTAAIKMVENNLQVKAELTRFIWNSGLKMSNICGLLMKDIVSDRVSAAANTMIITLCAFELLLERFMIIRVEQLPNSPRAKSKTDNPKAG